MLKQMLQDDPWSCVVEFCAVLCWRLTFRDGTSIALSDKEVRWIVAYLMKVRGGLRDRVNLP